MRGYTVIMSSTLRIRILSLFGLVIVATFLLLSGFISNTNQLAQIFKTQESGLLTVAFLDVGQGDAIFIATPDGVQMLIDGGPDATVLRELPKEMPFWDRSLDVILSTHPDKDHIGGLVDVLNRYTVSEIIRTANDSDTAVSSALVFASDAEGAKIHDAKAGEVIKLGASTTLTILSPAGDPTNWESNTSSLVAKLTYGEIDFMLTGDAPLGIEEYLVGIYGEALQSEVLKLGHHGSRTSSSANFLDTVAPDYAVVSSGLSNRYGHPHKEVVDAVTARGIKLINTANVGTIVFKSDGKQVWLENK